MSFESYYPMPASLTEHLVCHVWLQPLRICKEYRDRLWRRHLGTFGSCRALYGHFDILSTCDPMIFNCLSRPVRQALSSVDKEREQPSHLSLNLLLSSLVFPLLLQTSYQSATAPKHLAPPSFPKKGAPHCQKEVRSSRTESKLRSREAQDEEIKQYKESSKPEKVFGHASKLHA